MHNVHYQLALMRSVRQSIIEDRFPALIKQFFADRHDGNKTKYPDWAVEALLTVGVDLLE
jgi:queuine/archaeosine tRNA-ribosyltransferase